MADASDTAAASRTAEIVLDEWAKLHRQRSADSAGGIKRLVERRYPDFANRMHALADLTAAVASLLAMPGYVTDAEYQAYLQNEMRRLLPFHDGVVRKALAARLIAEYAMQNNMEVEDPRLVHDYEWPDRPERLGLFPCMETGPSWERG